MGFVGLVVEGGGLFVCRKWVKEGDAGLKVGRMWGSRSKRKGFYIVLDSGRHVIATLRWC